MYLVPGAGLEPARHCWRGILSPLCLPIPPPGHNCNLHYIVFYRIISIEKSFGYRNHINFSNLSRAIQKPSPPFLWPCQISGIKNDSGHDFLSILPNLLKSIFPSPI